MDMKRKMSLKTRLMLTTSLLLIIVSIVFTLFSMINTYFNVIKPFEHIIIDQLQSQDIVVQANDFFLASFIFMLIAIMIGCLLTYVVAKFSLKPLRKWSHDMEFIDQNQLSHRVDNPHTRDELDILANAFNQLLDRLQEAFQREKRFSAAVAHELKTPLTVVKTHIEVLQLDDAPTKEEYQETLEIIQKQNERMIKLVNDLMLMFSKNVHNDEKMINIDDMIKEIFDEFKLALHLKNIDYNYNQIGFCMNGNSTLIKHAFSNIIENAIKYNINDGKISIFQTYEDHHYKIVIRDTGIGIQEADIPYIFEPFYRGDKSRNRSEGGAGLGLALTKEIIESHHGHIEYQARYPKGSDFIITFPCCKEKD